jgi:hypothetical protein
LVSKIKIKGIKNKRKSRFKCLITRESDAASKFLKVISDDVKGGLNYMNCAVGKFLKVIGDDVKGGLNYMIDMLRKY